MVEDVQQSKPNILSFWNKVTSLRWWLCFILFMSTGTIGMFIFFAYLLFTDRDSFNYVITKDMYWIIAMFGLSFWWLPLYVIGLV